MWNQRLPEKSQDLFGRIFHNIELYDRQILHYVQNDKYSGFYDFLDSFKN